MYSIVNEIVKLRDGQLFEIDYENTNRYRIVVKEKDGSKTAYYFSTPIYNNKTKKILDFKFCQRNDEFYCDRSNTEIIFSDKIMFENEVGSCAINISNFIFGEEGENLKRGNDYIYPTTNGILYKMRCDTKKTISFEIEVDKPFMTVRSNNKYVAIMSESFVPFVSICCIGSTNAENEIIAPAIIGYQKLTDNKFLISISTPCPTATWVMFEVNMYEQKTFQDTTVESANPTVNNAFGSIGFIGHTDIYGEQWLYTKPDFYKFNDIIDNKISKVMMHIPQLNSSETTLSAFKLASRFCSFGSAWDNRVSSTNMVEYSCLKNGYQNIDITEMVIDRFGRLTQSDGCIIRTKNKDDSFCVISTSDSYYRPQIYEINFR